jgi:hypothetical protein
MVRMSDIVRGTARPAPPGPAAPAPAGREKQKREEKEEKKAEAPATPPSEAPSPLRLLSGPPGPPTPAARGPRLTGEAAEALFEELGRFLDGVPALIQAEAPFPWETLRALIERVVDALADGGDLFWVANRPVAPAGISHLAVHQARVAVLAVRLAAVLDHERRQLVEIGMAGALIDVGLWQMPPGLLQRLPELSLEEQARYRSHPGVGAALVRRWGPPSEAIVQAILHHHEREQGFPGGLAGAAIHPYARIVGLADAYTGLTEPPPLGRGLRPHEAVRDIVRSKAESFPVAHVKALLSEISVFPPGTLVRLNTGEVGRVVAVNRNQPLRPRVEICDARGRPVTPAKTVDLSEAPFLYITGALSEGGR